MATVKWIKVVTDIFDDEKMLMIEGIPSADSIMVIWFKLLCLAGKSNNSGVFIFNDRIPYTEEMLATIFRRDVSLVRLALRTFEQFGMIEIVDNVITIPNWSKHQTLDAYEKKKERDRERIREKRARQKALIFGVSHDASPDKSPDVAPLEEDIEEEKEEEIEIDSSKEESRKINYQRIADLYNETCVSFPKIRSLSDARKKAIRARMNTYTEEDFRALFSKAEASDFLKGKNVRNWTATFDWLIQDGNMAKVLDGNYDNKAGGGFGRKEVVPKWLNKTEDSPDKIREDMDRARRLLKMSKDEDLAERAEQLKKRISGEEERK